jgi:hypothetical protein
MACALNNLLVAHTYGVERGPTAAAILWSTAIVTAVGLAVALL